MKQKTTLVSVFMLMVILLGFLPQPVAAWSTCDAAQFISDVTIPDGTNITAGASFVKTWRIENVGSCTWSTSYNLVFVSGTQMGAPSTQALTSSVAPGSTIDLTVNLTAPSGAGTYRGYFQLRNASSTNFGIGSSATGSWWVEITVGSGGSSTGIAYDFVGFANDPGTTWTSGTGGVTITPTGTTPTTQPSVVKLVAPITLESGATNAAAGLLVSPDNNTTGFIQGKYPAFTVQSGDHFQSIVNCQNTATSCYVQFRLDYQIGSGPQQTFWKFNEKYDGLYFTTNIDLSSLAGQSVNFILYVGAAGNGTNDWAIWGGPRITRAGAVTPTPIASITPGPSPTPGPTSTPGSGLTDRVTFVSDVNYPDGTAVAPGATFTKTWRIKNTGTSTWTTSYKLVYISGDAMGGVTTALTSTVGPNTSVNVSVALTAPTGAGSHRGYWELQNASSTNFGLGSAANQPWWVDIYVSGTAPTSTSGETFGIDFTADPTTATWLSSAGSLPSFPIAVDNAFGGAVKNSTILMENGITYTQPSLLIVPQHVKDQYIQGVYPAYVVQTGDRFKAIIGCKDSAPTCNVWFRLDYKKVSDGTVVSNFFAFHEATDGLVYPANVDLSSLVGQNLQFILTVVTNNDDPSGVGSQFVMVAPRIVH